MILKYVRRKPVSRIEISKQTKLSKSAVTFLTNEMVQEGLLREIGVTQTTSMVGRKPILLDIVPDYRFAAGVGLHRKRITVSIVNLKLEQIARAEISPSKFNSPDKATAWISTQIQQLMAANAIHWEKCVGIGISSPGPLDYQRGIILKPPDLKLFADYPIVESLRSQLRLKVPISLENNSVLLAITDYLRNSLENFSQIMFITIWEGIGTAILSHGEIMRGFAGYTGELGHSSVDINGLQCSCGNRGCLEQYVSSAALQQRFKFEDYEKLVDDAYNNVPHALNILSFMAEYLGCAIANAANILDLDAIVLHGEFNYRPALLLERIREVVQTRSIVSNSHPINFLTSRMPQDDIDVANAIGVINHFFAQIP